MEHPGDRDGPPENVPKGANCPTAAINSASGPVYRGPGAPATGPQHHYTFEIYALDTKLDVPGRPTFRDAHEGDAGDSGHILGKAVYVGLFRRPQ